jgi:hypothetical protein
MTLPTNEAMKKRKQNEVDVDDYRDDNNKLSKLCEGCSLLSKQGCPFPPIHEVARRVLDLELFPKYDDRYFSTAASKELLQIVE